jgi:hypothetical protein
MCPVPGCSAPEPQLSEWQFRIPQKSHHPAVLVSAQWQLVSPGTGTPSEPQALWHPIYHTRSSHFLGRQKLYQSWVKVLNLNLWTWLRQKKTGTFQTKTARQGNNHSLFLPWLPHVWKWDWISVCVFNWHTYCFMFMGTVWHSISHIRYALITSG